ncbi:MULTISPECIES: C40 family peptidase [Prochlorococcus]|uniref:Cell wall-associated hydrolase n=1 Tax=Prochlorococcus marinus (strain SARG / CCMP1375 / SS120) TaxID=167539 RepID=Q7V9Z6_PROMA|nr:MULTISPECIES: C40 family peptidase [Prochlorococcus]AAQ00719.1 Cell wall-associated hydrolase [Prochlorococcus marinus subsp. marinus str. CCMP1375]KGG10784.1 hypothetical protein EV04_1745 [Prochlorococcus marinus str. LG]KGG20132.1 hypothetical protein EV08_1158 [Prochlorococcus marinus str. SS2]KGG24031.1 hypothetical protein EV09_0635 [Prochlorococcus marinus str. SS35]KGG31709.1 hypothetical protein EV10_1806 [Prochlorococcus marinus str. SS51]
MAVLKIACQKETLIPGSLWLLNNNINGYKNIASNELATEVIAGRKFEIIYDTQSTSPPSEKERVKVRLLEDGYICWLEIRDIFDQIETTAPWEPILLEKHEIANRLPKILIWIEKTSKSPNQYLWGGTAGPNFDCSGLVQTAFSSEDIWLPRDAYQQEKFCKPVDFNKNTLKEIIPGDLLFFGDSKKCTHVAIYKGKGNYWHSSGTKNGRNGIGIDTLNPIHKNSISSYYSSILRGAGRVESCHDGSSIA